jgi:DNA-directed RNA polymerase sigma subunit (sigma70/sigma32)
MDSKSKHNEELVEEYLSKKDLLKLKPRYLDIFEFRHGLFDGFPHSLAESGKKFGISGTRIRQLVARVKDELDLISSREFLRDS